MVQVDFKLVILGGYSVGKSSLMERLIHDSFVFKGRPSTIGAAFAAKPFMSAKGRKVIVGIWDTAGKERYEAMSKIFYRDAKVAVICYNICEQQSWEKMMFWIKELRENEENCKIYLCGTKKDLVEEGLQRRAIDFQTALRYANGIQSKVMETSSKTGSNVVELFQMIVDDYDTRPVEQLVRDNVVNLEETSEEQSKCSWRFWRCRI